MPAKPNEIQLIRTYDAPVKLVWEVWTDLEHVSKWWGPRGFTLTTKSKDFRPGGKWIYTMHGPDGTDYPNITTYHEIVKHEKLVYDHGGNEERPKLFTVTATFKEEKGKTTLCMTMAFDTAEVAKQMKEFIKQAQGNSTWDRLGEYLEQEQHGKDTFLINHSFDADKKTVFDMWVNPEHATRWLGPGSLDFQKRTPPDRLVYTKDLWETTVTFHDEGPGQTRVTVRREPLKGAMTTEWERTFDKLEALLEQRK